MAVQQSKNDLVKINNISVYKDFQERGYTTTATFSHFDDMKRDGITELIVDDVSQ